MSLNTGLRVGELMNQEQDTSTRKVILTMLKTQGPLSVNDMSKQLGITEMAVRRHLNTMERDSLVETKLVRQAMGRPTNVFSLTSAADDLFPKKYQNLT
jgi:predicted ArsR family transcriptional regulator